MGTFLAENRGVYRLKDEHIEVAKTRKSTAQTYLVWKPKILRGGGFLADQHTELYGCPTSWR